MVSSSVYSHTPVMLKEVLAYLQPKAGKRYCDATLGGGGHALAILEASGPTGQVIGIDRDPAAIASATARLLAFEDRFLCLQGTFGSLGTLLASAGISQVDGILADIGVSSPQINEPQRGFSFQHAGPIDMRMSPANGPSALDLIAMVTEEDLANIIFQYGEEKYSRRIAHSIKTALSAGTLTDTLALAQVVNRSVPGRDAIPDKVARTFQALRIAVNDELRELDSLLRQVDSLLTEGGTIVILSFHSLEDRIVKQHFQRLTSSDVSQASFELLTRKPVTPSEEEIRRNPRSRSTKLRAVRRVSQTKAAV